MTHAHYIRDDFNEAYRVWESRNPGDMFDMIPIAEFPLAFVERYPSLFQAGFPENDAGDLECPICLREQQASGQKKPRRAVHPAPGVPAGR